MAALRELHLEISTKCALACHVCPRTLYPQLYKVGEMPLEVVGRIAHSSPDVDTVTLCGDHGDPIYHSQFHDILRTLKTMRGEPYIVIATNGSYRPRSWWETVAEILRPKDRVVFGVDGLKDTSHIYRVNNDWESISTAIETLKSRGRCSVEWQWILFRYNQHQLREAAEQARAWRVDRFRILRSSYHYEDETFIPTLSIADAQNIFEGTSHDLSPL